MNKKMTQVIQAAHIPQVPPTKTHTASMEQASIPFNKLKLAERNVRSNIDKGTIEQLADDILNRGGLLQNLVTYRELDAQGKHTGFYKVFMVGRRWRALKFNVKRKAMKATDPPSLVLSATLRISFWKIIHWPKTPFVRISIRWMSSTPIRRCRTMACQMMRLLPGILSAFPTSRKDWVWRPLRPNC